MHLEWKQSGEMELADFFILLCMLLTFVGNTLDNKVLYWVFEVNQVTLIQVDAKDIDIMVYISRGMSCGLPAHPL